MSDILEVTKEYDSSIGMDMMIDNFKAKNSQINSSDLSLHYPKKQVSIFNMNPMSLDVKQPSQVFRKVTIDDAFGGFNNLKVKPFKFHL
jgi:hypothetical protein